MNRTFTRITSIVLVTLPILTAACQDTPTGAAPTPKGPTQEIQPYVMDPIIVDGCADGMCDEPKAPGGSIPLPPPGELPGPVGGTSPSPEDAFGPTLFSACFLAGMGFLSVDIVNAVQVEMLRGSIVHLRAVQKNNGTYWTWEEVEAYRAARRDVVLQASLMAASGIATAAAILGVAAVCSPGVPMPTP